MALNKTSEGIQRVYAHDDQIRSKEFQEHDMKSLIWYRIKKPFKKLDCQLKPLELKNYFTMSESSKFELTFKQKTISTEVSDRIMKTKNAQALKKSLCEGFDSNANLELLNLISGECTKWTNEEKLEKMHDVSLKYFQLDAKKVSQSKHLKDVPESLVEFRK